MQRPHKLLTQSHVLFLGSAVPDDTVQGLEAFQQPLRKVFPSSNSSKLKGIEAWISIYNSGVLLQLVAEKGPNPPLIWFPIQNMYMIAATKCVSYVDARTGTDRRSRFLDLSETQAQISRNPPLFSMIMRKTTGRQILQCHTFMVREEKTALAMVKACDLAYKQGVRTDSPPPEEVISLKGVNIDSDEEFDSVSATGKLNGKGPQSPESDAPSIRESEQIFPSRLVKEYSLSMPPPPRRSERAQSFHGQPNMALSSQRSHYSNRPGIPHYMMQPQVQSIRYVPQPSRPQIIERVIREQVPVPVPQIIREVVEVPVPSFPQTPQLMMDPYQSQSRRSKSHKHRDQPPLFQSHRVFDSYLEKSNRKSRPTIIYGDPRLAPFAPPSMRPEIMQHAFNEYDEREYHKSRKQDSRRHRRHRSRTSSSSSSSSSSSDGRGRKERDRDAYRPPPDPTPVWTHDEYDGIQMREKSSSRHRSHKHKHSSAELNGNMQHVIGYPINDSPERHRRQESDKGRHRDNTKRSSAASEFRWSVVDKPVNGRESLMNHQKPSPRRAPLDANFMRSKPEPPRDYEIREDREHQKSSSKKDRGPPRGIYVKPARSPSEERSPRLSYEDSRPGPSRDLYEPPARDAGPGDLYNPPEALSQPATSKQYYFKEGTADQPHPPRNWTQEEKAFVNEKGFSKTLADVLQKRGKVNREEDVQVNAYALNGGGENETMDDRSMPAPITTPGVIPPAPPGPPPPNHVQAAMY